MKVAVAASGDNLDAPTDPRFGRCPWFVMVDMDTMQYEAIENSGGGVQAAQTVANAGAEAVILGHIGPNAFTAVNAGGLQVYAGVPGTVRQAVQALKAGQLRSVELPDVQAHFAMGSRMDIGGPMSGPAAGPPGDPGGRGMDMGRGPGMGRGRGQAAWCRRLRRQNERGSEPAAGVADAQVTGANAVTTPLADQCANRPSRGPGLRRLNSKPRSKGGGR